LKAFNQRIHDAGLKTQNYDKGFDTFIRKFKPDQELSATVAIVTGFHNDRGTSVYSTQGKRRCLLLDGTCGFSDDEAIWLTLASWACFQPRRLQPRESPGRLCYLSEYSRVFETYWHAVPDLKNAPGFESESPFCQEHMCRFSSALSTMNLSKLTPSVTAKAQRSEVDTAEEAAISRLRPIQE
jgi:hypothetical protein